MWHRRGRARRSAKRLHIGKRVLHVEETADGDGGGTVTVGGERSPHMLHRHRSVRAMRKPSRARQKHVSAPVEARKTRRRRQWRRSGRAERSARAMSALGETTRRCCTQRTQAAAPGLGTPSEALAPPLGRPPDLHALRSPFLLQLVGALLAKAEPRRRAPDLACLWCPQEQLRRREAHRGRQGPPSEHDWLALTRQSARFGLCGVEP